MPVGMSAGAMRAELAATRAEAREVRGRLLAHSKALRASRSPELRSIARELGERRHRTRKLALTVLDLERLNLPAEVARLRSSLEALEAENARLRSVLEESRAREQSAALMVESLTASLGQFEQKARDLALALERQKDPARQARCRTQARRRSERQGEWESAYLVNLAGYHALVVVSQAYALDQSRKHRWHASLTPEAAVARLFESIDDDASNYWSYEDQRLARLEQQWEAEQAAQDPGESPP